MFLISEDDNSVESPNEDGRFIGLYSFTTSYEVKGDPIPDDASFEENISSKQIAGQKRRLSSMPLSLSQTTVAAGPGYSGFKFRAKKSKPPGVEASGKLKDSWRKTVDVCSVVEGSLKKVSNHPVTLTPSTACIEAISNIVSAEAFHGETIVLLDKDNLKIPDNKTTRSEQLHSKTTILRLVITLHYTD